MVYDGSYWFAKFFFQRGLALVYLIAFIAAVRQFKPLIEDNPYPDGPDKLRAKRYKYEFSDWEELKQGEWWNREEVGIYFPEISSKINRP